jgi:hypothetical protein
MKKILSSIGIVAVMLFSGCSSSSTPEPKVFNEEVPEWVYGKYPKDNYIYGVGSSKFRKGMFNLTRTEAMNNARVDLSSTIKTKVKSKIENFVRTTGTGDNETIDKVFTNVSKTISKNTLTGSELQSVWKTNDTFFVLLRISKDNVDNIVDSSMKSSFKNDYSLWQEFKAKQALDSLDKE